MEHLRTDIEALLDAQRLDAPYTWFYGVPRGNSPRVVQAPTA